MSRYGIQIIETVENALAMQESVLWCQSIVIYAPVYVSVWPKHTEIKSVRQTRDVITCRDWSVALILTFEQLNGTSEERYRTSMHLYQPPVGASWTSSKLTLDLRVTSLWNYDLTRRITWLGSGLTPPSWLDLTPNFRNLGSSVWFYLMSAWAVGHCMPI